MSSNVLGRKTVKKAAKYVGTASGSKKHLQILKVFNAENPDNHIVKVGEWWCDVFVTAIWLMMGFDRSQVPMSCNVDISISQAKKLGIWYGPKHKPRPGDAIILDWDLNGLPNHIGLVESVTDDYIHTIEGNAGNEGVCKRKTYSRQARIIFGYICPRYNAIYIARLAKRYAWDKGTSKARCAKSPRLRFKRAWAKYLPKKKIGSGCHQFVMLVMRAAGYKVMPLSWSKIIAYFKGRCNSVKFNHRASQLRPGDIMIYVRIDSKGVRHYHIWIIVEVDGKLMIAEARQGKSYAYINPSLKKALKKYHKTYLFRPKESK